MGNQQSMEDYLYNLVPEQASLFDPAANQKFEKLFDKHLETCSKYKGSQQFQAKFSKLGTNVERVDFILDELAHSKLPVPFIPDRKCDQLALKSKEEGNTHFGQGLYSIAFENYTKCIAQAESKEVQALGYANRSAALFKLQLFQECVEDIDRALASNYPDDFRPKLLTRKQKALDNGIHPIVSFEEVPVILNRNPKIQCASDSIEIQSNEKYGKHVVATKNIAIGEVIAIEDPFTCCVQEKRDWVHCHHCTKLCYNLIPCLSCTVTVYCNETCREKAHAAYHKFECPIAMTLKEYWREDLIGVRIAFQIRDENASNDDDGMYRSDRSREVLQLQKMRPVKNIFPSTWITANIFRLVKNHTTYFNCSGDEEERKLKETLLTIAFNCMWNVFAIFEITDMECADESLMPYADGIYAFSRIFTHSCCSNVSKSYQGHSVISRAIKTIKKGEICYGSFGEFFGIKPFNARQKALRERFLFDCDCRACTGRWPMVEFQPKKTAALERVNFNFYFEKLGKADVALAKHALPKFIKELKKVEHLEPCQETSLLRGMIQQCYDIFGNKRVVF